MIASRGFWSDFQHALETIIALCAGFVATVLSPDAAFTAVTELAEIIVNL